MYKFFSKKAVFFRSLYTYKDLKTYKKPIKNICGNLYKARTYSFFMSNKKVTISLDSKTYDDFKKYCEDNAIMLSKKIELWMRDFLNEAKNKKT